MNIEECKRPIAKKDRILLVEGPDDALLIEAICREEGLTDSVQILFYSQTARLGDFLDSLVRDSGFEMVRRIGLTRDADRDARTALQSLQDAWARAARTLSDIGGHVPECAFFVIPDNQRAGRVEDLCLQSPTFPEILKCAEDMHTCATTFARYTIDREKSLVAAYLSMMAGSRLQLGTAAHAGCWNLRSEAFGPLRKFVVSMGS